MKRSSIRTESSSSGIKSYRKWFFPFILLIFLGLIIYRGLAITEKKSSLERKKRVEVPVQVATVSKKHLTHSISMTGDILPLMQVDIFPKVSGYIERIYVRLGDFVPKGKVIAQIERTEYLQKVREAEARVNQAKAQLSEVQTGPRSEEIRQAEESLRQAQSRFENARMNRERIEALFRRQVVSKKEWDLAEMEYTLAEAQLASSRENLKLLKEGARKEVRDAVHARLKEVEAILEQERIKLQYTKIISPFAGEISRRYVDEGALVSPSTPLVTLVHTDTLKVVANILEKDISLIKIGMNAEIKVESFRDKIFEGKISQISSGLEIGTRTLQTEIYIPNQSHLLKPGMFANVKMVLYEKPQAIVVPKYAILEEEGSKFLFLVKGNQAFRRKIVTGYEQDLDVEIIGGISEGDQIVVRGQESIRDGSIVRVIEGS